MNTLRACLHFAYDSIRIERMPSFPKKGQFKLCAPDPQWVDEATQLDIISNIPKEHHPISSLPMAYLFLPTICKSLPR